MMSTYTRYRRELALVLIVAIVLAMVGCKRKKAGGEDPELSSILSGVESLTTEETTTEPTTSETTEATTTTSETTETTPEVTVVPPSMPETSETVPTETTLDPTAQPTEEPSTSTADSTKAPKPTKAPKETKATTTPTTPPTNTPTSTSTPTPVPTDTPTPTPTTAPKETKKATDYSSTIKSAVKQAITDKCGWKTGFAYNDKVMENAKARAKYSANNNVLGHVDMPGTVVGFEGCGSSGCTYLSDTDELEWFWTDESGNNHYYKGDPYQCYYDFAASLVVEHVNKLSSDTDHIYFGYGVSIKYTPWERSNGLGTVEEWTIVVYIEGETEMALNAKFS